MNYYEQNRQIFLEGLQTFLRIPSISTLSEHKPDIRRAAEFVCDDFRAAGLGQAELIEGEGNPLVYAEWTEAPGKPTLLLYGHYDVQPPDPLEEWKSPPFEPLVDNGHVTGRGASDNKGQLVAILKGVEAVMRADGRLPVNVKWAIEGEEESGGKALPNYLRDHQEEMAGAAVFVPDNHFPAPGLPAILTGLRGLLYLELEAQGAAIDLHSGTYGGAAPNPFNALAWVIAGLKDPQGRVTIPGFYDRVVDAGPEEIDSWTR